MKDDSIYNIRTIVLILGTACNFNCIYCVQHENKPRCKKAVSKELFDWLESVAYRLPLILKPTIQFYGGEPLLYRETIHTIIDRFGDKFKYSIISNGSRLTEEDVEYFNANKVGFVFSNDGANTIVTRQVNMFEDENFVRLFNRINNKTIVAVYSAYTEDLHALYEYFEEKSPGTPVAIEDLICNSFTDSTLVDFDLYKVRESYRRMGEETLAFLEEQKKSPAVEKPNRAVEQWCRWLRQIDKNCKSPEFPKFHRCGAGCSKISVDLEGNIYLCKNFNLRIGTVATPYEVLYQRATDAIKTLRDKNLEVKQCFGCSAFFHCRGGCPFEGNEASGDRVQNRCNVIRLRTAALESFIKNKLNTVTTGQ